MSEDFGTVKDLMRALRLSNCKDARIRIGASAKNSRDAEWNLAHDAMAIDSVEDVYEEIEDGALDCYVCLIIRPLKDDEC